MADLTLNTTAGLTIARELIIAYLNTGTALSPTWSPLGKRVEDSSEAYDWRDEVSQDILGNTFGTMKKPIVTQSFDPGDLDSGDAAIVKLWNLGVKDQNAQALMAQDMLIVHFYAGVANQPFAERYSECMIVPTGLGGEGGGNIGMPINVTYGGTRTTGYATKDASTGAVTFHEGANTPSVTLNTKYIELVDEDTYQLSATVVPTGASVTWTEAASAVATVSATGLVTAEGAGNTIITASITSDGVTVTDTCTVVVTAKT